VARESLYQAISACRPGAEFMSIGQAVESYVNEQGFVVNPFITGHGVGRKFHTFPFVFFVRNNHKGRMKPGMVFTLEPVISEAESDLGMWPDNWTIAGRNTSIWSAQFEHTVAITTTGVEILTQISEDL